MTQFGQPLRLMPHLRMRLAAGCLGGLFAACGVYGEREVQPEPYSPIEGDSVDVVIVRGKQTTVKEALDEAMKECADDSLLLDLRKDIEEKYRQAGDSMLRRLTKGENVH